VNRRGRAFVADLRAILERQPRAQAVSAHVGAWLQVYLLVGDDASVGAVGAELGLGPPTYVLHEGISWYHATSSEGDAAITVVGPRRQEDPAGEGAQP
jgi:hypothetical protein